MQHSKASRDTEIQVEETMDGTEVQKEKRNWITNAP